MIYKYGEFSDNQMQTIKQRIRKRIYFLLLIVDRKTRDDYKNVDVIEAFNSELLKIGGLNSLLDEPPELVTVLSLLEAALLEYKNEDFSFTRYRKLVLDAGNEVLKIKEVS